jgi:hypothetical protein
MDFNKDSDLTSSTQNLISAATGMNLTTVDDPIQRKFLPSFLRGVAEENKLVTSPNFVVTQALVALLADKGARLRPAYDKTDIEKRGLWRGRMLHCHQHSSSISFYFFKTASEHTDSDEIQTLCEFKRKFGQRFRKEVGVCHPHGYDPRRHYMMLF